MTVAEIHGKISETGVNLSERMEDLLTSDIFDKRMTNEAQLKTQIEEFFVTNGLV